jgi:hypothetical protein
MKSRFCSTSTTVSRRACFQQVDDLVDDQRLDSLPELGLDRTHIALGYFGIRASPRCFMRAS